jgi:proteasome lid subunit RPN8/RPN11
VADPIQIRTDVLEALIDHARQDPRIECCGFLAGRAGTIAGAYPAENVATNPATNYEVATKEIVHLTRAIREAGLEMLGIYHSHPNGKAEPSITDIATVGYPDVAYFIISPVLDVEAPVRAFSIRHGKAAELEMIVV